MENTGDFAKKYCTVLFVCMFTLLILAFQTNPQLFNNSFKSQKTSVNARCANKKKATKKKLCVDGQQYDTIKASIYQGSIYGDDKKNAKELRKYLRPYLKRKGYEQYTDIIIAICAQESRFGLLAYSNWMQVKGYTGPAGIVSTKAGTDHFIKVIEHAKKLECEDMTAIIQAYNFGNYYLDYCMDHGGKDTSSIRTSFQAYQKKKTGSSSYGDIGYAEKILNRVKK